MKIATYNLRNLFPAGLREGYAGDVMVTPEFATNVLRDRQKVVRAIAPDIVVMQEIGSKSVFEELAKIEGYPYIPRLANPDKRGIANGALVKNEGSVSSVADIEGFTIFREGDPDTIGGRLAPYRNFIALQTVYNDAPLYIYGIHLKASSLVALTNAQGAKFPIRNQHDAGDGLIRATIYRLAQARQLRTIVDRHLREDPGAQLIVLGDFNATEGDTTLRVVSGELRTDTSTRLTNLCMEVPKAKRFSYISRGERILIDHVLVTKNIERRVSSIDILNDGLHDQSMVPEHTYIESDHAPVVLSLS